VVTLSTFRRMPGVAYSIDHNDELGRADTPGWSRDNARNRELFEPYRNASGRAWLMREILRRRDTPVVEDNKATAGRYGQTCQERKL
jgi:hypothetical protein